MGDRSYVGDGRFAGDGQWAMGDPFPKPLSPIAHRLSPTLILICGLPGSGKTTLARQIERERPALRLSPDEWIEVILADPHDQAELDRLRTPVETVQWDVAMRVLDLGVDVVIEWGFWSREERRTFRERAQARGARVELRYLHVDIDVLWQRLAARNADLPPGTFHVTREQLELWASWFQPPTAEELATFDQPPPGDDAP